MRKKLLFVTLLTASTILSAGSYSRSNNIVTDHDRGLQWQDQPYTNAEIKAYNKTSAGDQTGRAKKWINAGAQCNSYGGAWRLPTKNELYSIVDTSRSPAINPVFQNAPKLGTWTGTTYSENTSQAWGIGFQTGGWHHCNKDGRIKLIRCVRNNGGGTPPPPTIAPPSANTPPIAKAGVDQVIIEGETVTLNGSGSTDPDGKITAYVWKKGSAILSRNTSFNKIFSVGTHTITLTVTDNDGASRSDSVTITVKAETAPENNPPVAKAGANQNVIKGDTVTLDGSNSTDPDGSITAYVWKRGSTILSRQVSFDKIFSVGTHTITLTVTDNDGASRSDSMTVLVSDPYTPPPSGDEFSSDNFSSNTLANYTTSGSGSWSYDSANERASIKTSGTTGFSFSRSLASSATKGTFSFDVNPVKKNGATGLIELRLKQDANTYYKIINRDGSKTGGITKYVNGTRVDSKWFRNGYSQGRNYTISVTFSPGSTTVKAFGQTLTIQTNKSSINVSSFTIKVQNQNANFDNISYTTSSTTPPSGTPPPPSGATPPSGENDNFSSNTLANYTTSGSGSWSYDSANERASIKTSGTTGFSFSRSLASSATKGTFSFDVNPVKKNGATGLIELRLKQDANTYYKIINRDGSKTGGITKYVNGTRVDSKWFRNGYSQGRNYTISVTFSPGSTTVKAFGQTLTIQTNKSSINVSSFTIKVQNQNANFDNISYN